MNDRSKVSSLLARRLGEHLVSLPAVFHRAGLPAGFLQQEKIYVTTAKLFALWQVIGEITAEAAIGLELETELQDRMEKATDQQDQQSQRH